MFVGCYCWVWHECWICVHLFVEVAFISALDNWFVFMHHIRPMLIWQRKGKHDSVSILLGWRNNHDFDTMQPKYIHSMTPSQQRHQNSQRESYWRLPHLICWHLYAESCSATRAVKRWLQWSKRCVKYSTNGVLLRFLRSSTWWLLFFGVYNLFVGLARRAGCRE